MNLINSCVKRDCKGEYIILEECDIDMTKNIWLEYKQNNVLVDESITIRVVKCFKHLFKTFYTCTLNKASQVFLFCF